MNLKKKNKKFLERISTITRSFILLIMQSNISLATGIGTQEVQTATDNIKRVITSIAMPLGRCTNLCEYCCGCNKNDSKC